MDVTYIEWMSFDAAQILNLASNCVRTIEQIPIIQTTTRTEFQMGIMAQPTTTTALILS